MFDYIFDMDSTQDDVFEKVGDPVLNNILEGFHGTIMAYGQTSSGKTHTMQGYDLNEKDNRGIMPRMVRLLLPRSNVYSQQSRRVLTPYNSN
jgi:kinesin family member 5